MAVAVRADAEYGRTPDGDWIAVATAPDTAFVSTLPGEQLAGWRYAGAFDDLAAVSSVEHRVIL